MKTILLTTLSLMTSAVYADTHSALTLRHRESQGVGYNQGYSTLDYYLTSQHDKLEFLFNLRGHLFNDAKTAGNGGFAFRYSLNDDNSRLGVNLYYDVRETTHFVVQQVASGLEWMSQNIDVRMNSYVPIGKQRNFSQYRFEGFTGNHVLIKRKFTGALPSIEGEIGTSLANPFYFAAGTYYLFRETSHAMQIGNAWGWKARFDIDMGSYFTVGALITQDRIFKARIQGYLALNIPLGPWKSMKDESKNFERRRIIRNEIIPIQSRKRSKSPLTSSKEQVLRFIFVNNQATPRGDGTFEHPFSSLKEAEVNSQSGDVIYVYPGDGTPRHMDEGIILKDSQVLASTGSSLELNNVEIPAQTPGQNPTITNVHPNKPVITNPGKSQITNFYYMNPWEYLKLYDPPSYSSDASFVLPEANSPYDDPSLDDWVTLE
ncbi:MAG: hypothetical protein ACRDFB_00655 [Rhabdochlamydiaceae bacterium]